MAYKGETKLNRNLELRSCVKVDVAVLGHNSYSPYGLYGRRATLNLNTIIYIYGSVLVILFNFILDQI